MSISSTYLVPYPRGVARRTPHPGDETTFVLDPPDPPLHTKALDTNLKLPCASGFCQWSQLVATLLAVDIPQRDAC